MFNSCQLMTWRWSLLRWRIKFNGISFSEIEGLIWRLNKKIVTFPFVFLAELFLSVVYLVSVCNFKCLRAPVLCKRLCVHAWIVSFYMYMLHLAYITAWIPVYDNKLDLYAWSLTAYISNLYAWSLTAYISNLNAWSVAILSTFLEHLQPHSIIYCKMKWKMEWWTNKKVIGDALKQAKSFVIWTLTIYIIKHFNVN